MIRPLMLACAALVVGCATPAPFPARPDVSWYVHQDPLMIPQAPVKRPGMRAIMPPPVPAPLCLTDQDHLALEAYLDQVEAACRKK